MSFLSRFYIFFLTRLGAFFLLFLLPSNSFASKTWSIDMLSLLNSDRIAEAKISNISIHDEGHIFLSHTTQELAKIGPDVFVWDALLWRDFICVATRNKGLILVSTKDNSIRSFYPDREITAMAVSPDDKLYFSASSEAQSFVSIYVLSVPESDLVDFLLDIQQTQVVWSMSFLREDLYLASASEQGTVIQISGLKSGKPMATPIFTSKESSFLKIVAADSSLYVSSSDKSFLYHIPVSHSDNPEILYEPDAPCQISDFFFKNGRAFVSVVRKHPIFLDIPGPKPGPGVRSLQKSELQSTLSSSRDISTNQTVSSEPSDDEIHSESPDTSRRPNRKDSARVAGGYIPGPQKSVLYSIDENGYLLEEMSHPSKIFSAITRFRDDSIGVLLYDENKKSTSLVSYSLLDEGRKSFRLLANFQNLLIHRILPKDDKVFFVSTSGQVLSMDSKISQSGELILPNFDAGNRVRWGYFSHVIHGPDTPSKMSTVRFFARTGQSSDTSRLWSDWQECVDSRVPLPESRFIQFKVVFPKEAASLRLSDFQLYYSHPNRAPIISKFQVNLSTDNPSNLSNRSGKKSSISWAAEAPPSKKIFLQWLVSDPDQDDPPVSIFFRLRRPAEIKMGPWTPLLSMPGQFRDATLDTFDLDVGYYQFKLVVSDKTKNPVDMVESSSAVSRVIFVENGRPKVLDIEFKNDFLHFSCKDALSPIADVRISFDLGQTFQSLVPKDNIFDQKEEYFSIKIPEDVISDPNPRIFIIVVSDIYANQRRVITTYTQNNGRTKK